MRRRTAIAIIAVLAVSFVALAPPSDEFGVLAVQAASVPSPGASGGRSTSKSTTKSTPTPAPTPSGVVIGVAIFRDPQPKLKLAKNAVDPYKALVTKITGLGTVFKAWVVDDPGPCRACRLSDAQLYIYGKEAPPSEAELNGSLTLTSFFVKTASIQRIGSVALAVDDTQRVPDLPAEDAKKLIGSLTLDENFQVSVNLADSEQTLQLVPAPVNATDPDYEPILEHILANKGLAATRSRFTVAALRGPRDSVTCPGAQRYFVYRVRQESYPRKLLGVTRLEAYAEGFILDCGAPAAVPAATGRKRSTLPTTTGLLSDLTALVVALHPKLSSANLTGSTTAFAKLVDVNANDTGVRDTVASGALDQMVNNMCIRLLEMSIAGSPSPSPSVNPKPSPSAGAMHSPGLLARAMPPPPLQCGPPARRQAQDPNKFATFDEIYRQAHGIPAPSAKP